MTDIREGRAAGQPPAHATAHDEHDGSPSAASLARDTYDGSNVAAAAAAAEASMAAPFPTPATHAYLGEATTGSSLSRTDLEVGSTIDMPILSLPGVVLFPGESLPLRLHNPAYALLVMSLLEGGGGAAVAGSVRRGRGGSGASGERQAARHLGVVNRLTSRSGGLLVRTSPVGTTAEIRAGYVGSAGDDTDDGGAGGLAVMARGRHRFRLKEDLGWRRGVRYWRVVICPDLCPGPLSPPIPRAFRDFSGHARGDRGGGGRGNKSHWTMAVPRFVVKNNSPTGLAARAAFLLREQKEPLPRGSRPLVPPPPGRGAEPRASRAGGEGAAEVFSTEATEGRSNSQALAQAQRPPPPPPLLPQDRDSLRRPAGVRDRWQPEPGSDAGRTHNNEEDDWNEEGEEEGEEKDEEEKEQDAEGDGVPRRAGKLDPTLFSFWLAANLPLDDDARQQLLMLDSVVMRLRLEVKHLEKSRRRSLCCAGCGIDVAWEADVFTLPGAEGVVGAYVNPQGHVHQTVTVSDARNLALVGAPEEEHTWFPGYAWTIACCGRCPHHLGWRFTAIGRQATDADQRQQRQRQHRLNGILPSSPQQSFAASPPSSASSRPPSAAVSSPSSSSSPPSPPPPVESAMGGGTSGTDRLELRAEDNPNHLGPTSFFGLCRSSLVGEVRDL